MQTTSLSSTRASVMRYGLIFGAILGALDVGNSIVQGMINSNIVTTQANSAPISVTFTEIGASAILSCVVFLVMLALTFVAGILAARRTGKVSAGSLAGLLAGAVGGLLSGAAGAVVTLTLVAPAIQSSPESGVTPAQAPGLFVGMTLGAFAEILLVNCVFGAGLGALGGLVGASFYRNANPPSYQPPFYPGAPGSYPMAPYAGPQYPAPPYPGQPGYPAYPPSTLPQAPQPPQQG